MPGSVVTAGAANSMSNPSSETSQSTRGAVSSGSTETHGATALGDPLLVLRQRFGLPDFRDGQRAVIERLLAGKNVAAVFPTGAGKSLCYQLPSQMLPGTTVVVSPLIALMKDQCDCAGRSWNRRSQT